MTTPNHEVNCEYCVKMATSGCLHCVVVFCDDCKGEHLENNHNIKMLKQFNGVACQKENMEGTSKLEHKYTSVEQVEPLTFRRTSPRVRQSSKSSSLIVR